MSEFKFQQQTDGTQMTFTFEGNIDEDVKFPAVAAGSFKTMNVDLKGVKAINSVGIREWLNWIRPLSEIGEITLVNAPKALVFQLNMVEGFLPKGGKVSSFFVPFYCEKCDREENVLFNMGKEVTLSSGNYQLNFDIKKSGLCNEGECELEMDATEAKYFQFLKRLG